MISKVDVVLLAGGGALKADHPAGGKKASTQAAPGTQENKALLTIGGRPMVDYVIEALRGCPEVGQIVLVGDASLQKAYRQTAGLLSVAPGDSPLGSLASGVAALEVAGAGRPAADWVLSCTGDIPFLTAGAVSGFLRQCSRREADFYYPITARQEAEARFPGVKRTYARLRDGAFTGGNLFLVRRSIIREVLPKAEGFIRLRKKPLAMAQLVGPVFLLAYLFGFLTIAMVEKRISGMVGYRGAAVISDYPEIGVDVDKISDLDLARRLLAP
jgi:CTP:molybdopterin cytidylyltransferase MocA